MALDAKAGARLLVRCLELHGVDTIFGIPGAKIDAVYDALVDSSIRVVLCRHEQNAAFMAACVGRLTGKPGVVLVTSGPGVANLCTGLLTATTEGDPVVAIGGSVPLSMALKASHQAADNILLMKAVTKFQAEIRTVNSIPEVVENAFRAAIEPQSGAAFISLPQDISLQATDCKPLFPSPLVSFGCAQFAQLDRTVAMIEQAQCPVLLLGQESSRQKNTDSVRALLAKVPLAVVSTYQASGVISRDLLPCFCGRVGLFQNQPGDQLLAKADVVVTVGFNPAEYDPEVWNADNTKTLIHVDYQPAAIRMGYQPQVELLGDVSANLDALRQGLNLKHHVSHAKQVQGLLQEVVDEIDRGKQLSGFPIHPLRFINDLRQVITDEDWVVCDIGTIYMWMARYFFVYEPRHLLFSNGQQTLGVALPWAMGCHFVHPNQRIISMSGDGGFLFSAMELETAVREGSRFVHIVWEDGNYDMVKEQQLMKYERESAVSFRDIDLVSFAHSFGADGFAIKSADQIIPVLQKALQCEGPALVSMPVDYSDNQRLFQMVDPDCGH